MTQQSQPLTTKLNNGFTVLAKLWNGQPSAMTFANLKQANAAAEKFGGWVHGRRPFYVCFDAR